MLFYQMVKMRNEIEADRELLNQLTGLRGFLDPEVIKESQKLDEKIVEFQKVLVKNPLYSVIFFGDCLLENKTHAS